MTPRLPWGPLESLVDARLYRADLALTDVNRAVLLGTNRTQIARWRRYGVRPVHAEQCAEAIGFIAYEIWPSLLADAITDLEAECAAPDCATRFVRGPKHPHQRFCSKACRQRVHHRMRYSEDPAHRQRRIDRQREYDRLVREAKARRAGRRAA